MLLGTLDRSPPPFFRQGPSALSKLIFFSAVALFLMVADSRFAFIQPLRLTVATVLYPVERVLLWPVRTWLEAGQYTLGLHEALGNEARARRELALVSAQALRADQLEAENAQLRALLLMRPALKVKSVAAQVLFDAPDPYSRKVIIDAGIFHGVSLGSAVVHQEGVLGQVTRVFPLSAEVTLLSDKNAVIPVLNVRNQTRTIAFGSAENAVTDGLEGVMELRFMAGNADIRLGDEWVTSGLDGVYPPGLPVARVNHMERKADSGFARILLTPAANPEAARHVLVIEPVGLQMPAREDLLPSAPALAASQGGAAASAAPLNKAPARKPRHKGGAT
jgi:rod shape-determining protein MreC